MNNAYFCSVGFLITIHLLLKLLDNENNGSTCQPCCQDYSE